MGSPVPPLPGGSGGSLPPPVFPPLHHHHDEEEQQPQRGEDYDMLSGWARSLSVSPRLYPTYGNESALPSAGMSSSLGLDSPHFGATGVGAGHRGLSGSPVLAPVRRESQLTVGTGLSPELGPTRVGSRNSSFGGAAGGVSGSSSMMASGSGFGQDYSYASTFGAHYADSPPSESLANHHHSPHESTRPAIPSPAPTATSQQLPLSFSNLSNLASLSPHLPPLPPTALPSQPTPITASSLSTLLASLPPLPSGLTTSAPLPQPPPNPQPHPPAPTSGTAATADEEDPRIRAYAKLEFPTFDIYIQKLSVIIGRRPAAAVLAAAAKVGARSPSAPVSVGAGTPGASGLVGAAEPVIVGEIGVEEKASGREESGAPGEGEGAVKLEDFVMGMDVDEALKQPMEPEKVIKAEPGVEPSPQPQAKPAPIVPQLSVTPSSPKPQATTSTAPIPSPSAAATDEPAPTADAFAEFLKSSPHTAATAPPSTSTADCAIPPLSLPPPAPSPAPSPAPVASTSVTPAPQTQPQPQPPIAPSALPPGFLTDIDLGPIRAVSRQHARLYFDYELGGWAIEVLGRNGVVVDGKWLAKGEKSGMSARTKIQIAERVFFFVLPTIDPPSTVHQPVASTSALDALAGDSDSELSELDSDLSSLSSSGARARARSASRNPLLDGDGDSSSLSELSESDVELSPLQNPHDGQGLERPTGLKLSLKAPRYDANGHLIAGKRLEMLQAVRSGGKGMGMGGGGKGKGAQRRGGKGKGKMLPPKRPRRDSWAYDSDEEEEEDSYGYSNYGGRSYADYEDEVAMMMEKGEVDEDEDDDDMETAQSPPKRNLELKRAVESKRPNFAQALALKAPPMGGGKSAGQMANKKRKHDINKIVIKRKDSQPTPPPAAGGSRGAKMPAKAPAAATKMPRRQADPNSTAPGLGAALSNPALLPPLPPSSALGLLPADGTTALSPAHLPPLPLPPPPADADTLAPNGDASPSLSPGALNGTPGVPGIPAKRPRARSNATKNGAPATKPKKSPAPPKQKSLGAAPANGIASDAALAGGSTSVLVYGPHTATGQPPLAPRAPPYTPAAMPPGPPPDRAPLDNIFVKPPYTYASLIAQAVSDSPEEKLTLTGINDWLVERWPYFRDNQPGWQNSVRHNLTLARGFLKVARRADEHGKGSFWTIDPEQRSNFDGHHFRKKATPKTTGAISSTNPGPANGQASTPTAGTPPGAIAPTPSTAAAAPTPSLTAPLPIIIAPIPDSYVRQPPPPTNGVPPDDLTAALLKDPPIVLHEGRLILNPSIFAHLGPEQLDNLQVLPASQALQILQAYVVQHFKEKMKKMAQEKAAALAKAEAEAGELEEGEIVSTEPAVKPAEIAPEVESNGKAAPNGSAPWVDVTPATGSRNNSPMPTPPPPVLPTGPSAMSKAIPTGPRADRNRPSSPASHRPSSPAPHKPPTRSQAAHQPPPSAPKGPRAMMHPNTPTGPRAQRVTRQQVASSSSSVNNKRKLSESTSGGAAAKVVKVSGESGK